MTRVSPGALASAAAVLAIATAAVLSSLGSAYTAQLTNIAPAAGTENLAGIGDPLNPPDLPMLQRQGVTWSQYVSLMHMWGGVAIDDVDLDGWPDIYLTNDGPNVLYRNNHDLTFTDIAAPAGVATGGRSMGAAFGDFDNDGCRDLFVASFDGPSTLYRANCDGTFTNGTAAANISVNVRAAGVAWGDFDRDGDLDLAVGCYITCQNIMLRNNGDGTFSDVSSRIIEYSFITGLPSGGWTFQPVWVDYDQDGDLDLWDVNDFGPDHLLRNNDDGTFTDVSLIMGIDREGAGGMGLAIGDINNDGWLDYLVTNYYNDSIYKNFGGNFDEAFTGSPVNDPLVGWGTEFFDADNDGYIDLYLANGFIFEQTHDKFQDDKLLRNTGNGVFVNSSSSMDASYGGVSHGMASADFDRDGDLDVFVFNVSGPSMLFRNDGAKGSYLFVNLTGSVSNRDAVGAIVTARAGGQVFTRFLTAGASYLSQSQRALHFGLGNHTLVDSLTIDWPSGARTVLTNLTLNQTVDVVEPAALIARAGGDLRVRVGEAANLSAALTTDPLDPSFPAGANFTWRIDLGGTFAVLYGETASITLTSSGAYPSLLCVTDSLGNNDCDPFVIYVLDGRPPVAQAGPDQTVCDAAPVVLDGAGSTDNDPYFSRFGNFTWRVNLLSGPVTLYGSRVSLRIEVPGSYSALLTVRDPTGNEASDVLAVDVVDCTAPRVNVPASVQAEERLPVLVHAEASDSSAGFAQEANYTWSFDEGAARRVLYGADFSYTFDVPGTYSVELRVMDGAGNAAAATIVVVVADVTPPRLSIPERFFADERTLLRFDASGSTDNDPTFPSTATFTWTVVLPVQGGTSELLLFGVAPTYAFSTPGGFPVVLNVTDRAGNFASKRAVVEIRDRTPPVVHAGVNREVAEGDGVTLEATATDNDPAFSAGASRYRWNFTYGDGRVELEGQRVSFTFERTGVYLITLTVSDEAGNEATDHIDVRVVSGAPDPWPTLHRMLAVVVLAAALAAAIPAWRKGRAKAVEGAEDEA